MNSFTAIAARHDTTLAVVAPGIAEALFATAMGLFAAMPAVIFYNRFVNEIGRYVNSARRLRRRILRHPVAPAGREGRADGCRHATMSARGRGRRRRRAMSEINVTPFVDVMLVLLDRLHGDGAAADRGRAGGPAQDPRAGAGPGQRAACRSPSRRTARSICRRKSCRRTRWCPSCRPSPQNGYDQRIFVRGDKTGGLWPGDGGDGPAGKRGLHPYRTGDRCRKAKARRGTRRLLPQRPHAPDHGARTARWAGRVAAAACRADRRRPISPGRACWISRRKAMPCRSISSPSTEQTNVAAEAPPPPPTPQKIEIPPAHHRGAAAAAIPGGRARARAAAAADSRSAGAEEGRRQPKPPDQTQEAEQPGFRRAAEQADRARPRRRPTPRRGRASSRASARPTP